MIKEDALHDRGAAIEAVFKGRATCPVEDGDGRQSLVCDWTPHCLRSEGGVTTESPTKRPLAGQRRGQQLFLCLPRRETLPSSIGQR
jgi:hypothetical protein